MGAWAAVASALAAVAAMVADGWSSRRAMRVETLLSLDERFRSQHMKESRARAARMLIGLRTRMAEPPVLALDDPDRAKRAIDHLEADAGRDKEILNFFEMMGILSKKRAIDLTMAWNTFYVWAKWYWLACSDLVAGDRRSLHPRCWQHFEALVRKMDRQNARNLVPQPWRRQKRRRAANQAEARMSSEVESFLLRELRGAPPAGAPDTGLPHALGRARGRGMLR